MVAAIPASRSFEVLWAHRQTGEPMLASLWSHRQPGAKHKQSPRSGISFACLLLLVVAVSQEIRYGLLSTSNGRIVSFLKSVHMVNYYWPKARLSARSLLGCTLLKFVGSSLISFALGEGLLIASPRHLLSFVCAWSLVRSDSVEATQLSRLLRHSVPLHLLLNFTAAIYKLRKLGFLVAQSSKLGSLQTVLLGTAAFSAANLIMKLESLVLTHLVGIPLCSPPMRPVKAAAASVPGDAAAAWTAGSLPPSMTLPQRAPPPAPAPASSQSSAAPPPLKRSESTPVGRGSVDDIMTPDLDLDLPPISRDLPPLDHAGAADTAASSQHAAAPPVERESGSFKRESGAVEPPNIPKALFQNFCLVATLVLGESCGHLTAAKLLLLTFLCCYYNKNLWYKGLLRSSTGVCLRAPASVLRCSRSMLSLCPQPASRKAADAYPVAECPPLGPGAAPGAAPALQPERAKQE